LGTVGSQRPDGGLGLLSVAADQVEEHRFDVVSKMTPLRIEMAKIPANQTQAKLLG
jgi:hypothetical protein